MSSDDTETEYNPSAIERIRNDPAMPIAAWLEFFRSNPFDVCAADILCLGRPSAQRIVNLAATILLHFGVSETGEHIRHIRIILPPSTGNTPEASSDKDFWLRAITKTITDARNRDLSPEETERLSQFLVTEMMTNIETRSIIKALETSDAFSVQFIVHAAAYQADGNLSFGSEPGPNKRWVPHVHDLAQEAVRIATDRTAYILIDTGELARISHHGREFRPHVLG